ncbi:hypothetical protein HY772_04915 [Candidatus Woesearchaeota archaeon]|nr:hypothetical protein [Candidatus Woesearchaeota archaeon]
MSHVAIPTAGLAIPTRRLTSALVGSMKNARIKLPTAISIKSGIPIL